MRESERLEAQGLTQVSRVARAYGVVAEKVGRVGAWGKKHGGSSMRPNK